MENHAKPTFVIIDGNAILHRAYHALPQLKTREGVIVNAVYGFAMLILKMLRELKPEYIAVAFDRKEPTFRHQMYKEYKAKRPKAPQDLYDQISIIKDMLRVFEISVYEKAGYEADDIIATLAKAKNNIKKIIITGDKDTFQLIDKNIVVHTPSSGIKNMVKYDVEKIKEIYGLSPEQLIDYKALRGDPSDNIPGVRGIGEKTAINLIKIFKNIDQLYKELIKETERTKKIKEKIKKLLLISKPDAFKGKELVKLIDNVPIDFALEDCKIKPLNNQKIMELFKGLGFVSLVKRMGSNANSSDNEKRVQTKLL